MKREGFFIALSTQTSAEMILIEGESEGKEMRRRREERRKRKYQATTRARARRPPTHPMAMMVP